MSKNGSIELSPKYGLNPTIPVCFWCGKEKNELALLGRVRKRETPDSRATGDYEASPSMVLSYEPCDCCREQFNKGVRLIEVTPTAPDCRPAITCDGQRSLYPTGRLYVIKSEAAKRLFNVDPSTLEAGKALCLDEEAYSKVSAVFNNSQESNI